MVSELFAASQKEGLKINIAKTQFMTNFVPSCNLTQWEGPSYLQTEQKDKTDLGCFWQAETCI